MSIQDRFCPRCGRPTENEGLCTSCLVQNTTWFTCDSRVTSTWCPSCGAIKQVNTWTDTNQDRSVLAPELACSAVHFHPDVKKPSVEADITDISPNRSKATMRVRGVLYNTDMEGTCTTDIIWHKEQCDRCNRISGSYYEGVVQVRADGRDISPYEIQMAAGIAQQVEDSLQAGGERLSFISDIHETREGLDIIVGSQHIGLSISQAIVAQLGGRFTTHPKLVGERNGRPLHRITYSVRLPRYRKHDVVKTGRTYAEVERVESGHLRVLDLASGTTRALREEEVDRCIGNARNAEPALVAFADGNTIGVLDPVSCRTVEFAQRRWLPVEAGQHVGILRDGDYLVIMR
jgi:nonsense-mediated mRNA decay protein 3